MRQECCLASLRPHLCQSAPSLVSAPAPAPVSVPRIPEAGTGETGVVGVPRMSLPRNLVQRQHPGLLLVNMHCARPLIGQSLSIKLGVFQVTTSWAFFLLSTNEYLVHFLNKLNISYVILYTNSYWSFELKEFKWTFQYLADDVKSSVLAFKFPVSPRRHEFWVCTNMPDAWSRVSFNLTLSCVTLLWDRTS